MYGGPMNVTTGRQAMNGEPAANKSVTVRSGSRVAATGTTDASGRFRIELAPGRYTLSCSGATAFTVVAGATVEQDCNLAIP
jgi:hypothetical protein